MDTDRPKKPGGRVISRAVEQIEQGIAMVKLTIIILSILVTIFLLDSLLPTTKWETTYFNKSNDSVTFVIPGTGGGTDSCAAKDIQTLPSQGDIVIETTAILKRCSAHSPSWPIDTNKFVENAIRDTYHGIYSNLNELRKDYPRYTPSVRLCGKAYWFLPASSRLYSVQLPEKLLILDSSGERSKQSSCEPPSNEGYKIVAPLSWQNKVKKMKAKGEDIEIIKSEYMTPEKTPAEFWAAFTKELQNPNFNFDIFVKKVARGFIIERQYNSSDGIDRIIKQGFNPNYSVDSRKSTYQVFLNYVELREIVIFNKQFCLPSKWVEKLCVESNKCENSERNLWANFTTLEQRKITFGYDRDNTNCVNCISFSDNLNYQ
jgi:hypothetical protein